MGKAHYSSVFIYLTASVRFVHANLDLISFCLSLIISFSRLSCATMQRSFIFNLVFVFVFVFVFVSTNPYQPQIIFEACLDHIYRRFTHPFNSYLLVLVFIFISISIVCSPHCLLLFFFSFTSFGSLSSSLSRTLARTKSCIAAIFVGVFMLSVII